MFRGRTRMKRDRRALQCLRAQTFDQCAARDDECVAGLDRLAPHLRHDVWFGAQRCGVARRRPVHEVSELAGLVPREEESRAPHQEHLRRADARAVDLVVHHDGARHMQPVRRALLLHALRRSAIRQAQSAAERHLDATGEVVEVLLLREVGHLARDRHAGPGCAHLTEQIEAALRAEGRADVGLVYDNDVRLACSDIGRTADLGDE